MQPANSLMQTCSIISLFYIDQGTRGLLSSLLFHIDKVHMNYRKQYYRPYFFLRSASSLYFFLVARPPLMWRSCLFISSMSFTRTYSSGSSFLSLSLTSLCMVVSKGNNVKSEFHEYFYIIILQHPTNVNRHIDFFRKKQYNRFMGVR